MAQGIENVCLCRFCINYTLWMEPYLNENVNIYMISYVIPLYSVILQRNLPRRRPALQKDTTDCRNAENP